MASTTRLSSNNGRPDTTNEFSFQPPTGSDGCNFGGYHFGFSPKGDGVQPRVQVAEWRTWLNKTKNRGTTKTDKSGA